MAHCSTLMKKANWALSSIKPKFGASHRSAAAKVTLCPGRRRKTTSCHARSARMRMYDQALVDLLNLLTSCTILVFEVSFFSVKLITSRFNTFRPHDQKAKKNTKDLAHNTQAIKLFII